LTNQSDRQYQQYSAEYSEIENDLQSLYKKNESRQLNEESTKISKSILGLWTKYKEKHQLNDKYSNGNAELDRERFVRLFSSAQSAESAKKM
jgi:predicted secreted Zn-dependent protease